MKNERDDRPAGIGPVANTEDNEWALLCEEVAIEDWVYRQYRRREQAHKALHWALGSGIVLLAMLALALLLEVTT